MKLHEEIFQVNGIAMNVASVGAGPVVLLLHGFPDTHAVRRKQVEAWSRLTIRSLRPTCAGMAAAMRQRVWLPILSICCQFRW